MTTLQEPPPETDVADERVALPSRIALGGGFRYIHEPLVDDSGPIRFLGDGAVIDGLKDRIRHSDGGSFLVTGFRGAGKTTAVLRTLREVEDMEPETLDYLPVVLNVARPVTLDALLFEIVRRLFEALIDSGILDGLEPEVRRALVLAYARTSLSFKQTRSEATENSQSLGFSPAAVAPALGMLAPKLGLSRKRTESMAMEASFLAYSHGDVEHDFMRILDLLHRPQAPPGSRWRRLLRRLGGGDRAPWQGRVVVVLDELDKLTGTEEGKRTVGALLSGLKNILTTRDVHFIFVGGPDLHDAAMLDAARGNSVYESVFAYEAYVPCLWEASGDLLGELLGEADVTDEQRALLRDYLDYKARGIPRLLLRELNELVRWEGETAYLELDGSAASRIALYSELQGVVKDFIEADERDEAHGLPIDLDRSRLATYYISDWVLRRRRHEFAAREIVSDEAGGAAEWLSSVTSDKIEGLIDRLVDAGIVRPTWDPATGTIIGDAPQERRFEVTRRVKRQLSALVREDARIRDELRDEEFATGTADTDEFEAVRGGRYVLRSVLGRGGTGTVYRADDTLLRREVAIKMLEASYLRNEDRMRARFRREAQVAGALSHPGIASTYEIFEEDDGRLGIVMELVEGPSLRDVLPVPAESAVRIAAGLLNALDYLGASGMARVDVKPDNIIIATEMRPVIIDLGIVKPTGRARGGGLGFDTMSGLEPGTAAPTIGTPAYMSPEQIRSETVDIRSDIYALGLVVYEMITGERAHQGETPMSVLMHTIQGEIDIAALPVSLALRDVVRRATAREVDDRYQSPGEMLAALLDCPEAAAAGLVP